MSIVSLLAINKDDEEAPLSVCKSQWYLAACAFLVSVLTLAVSSAKKSITAEIFLKLIAFVSL